MTNKQNKQYPSPNKMKKQTNKQKTKRKQTITKQETKQRKIIKIYIGLGVTLLVFNANFNNISSILWRSVLLVDETGVPGENH
jgi:hypothetical protein